MAQPKTPPWASSTGRDGAGVWVAFVVEGVSQRLRWIAPGPTRMGAPETETEPSSGEGPPRIVEVAAGFWLGETPVTEGLWAAVTRAPPLHVTGPRRPVTCVSWDDAQAFLTTLHERVAGLHARLPLEREWEHACRAGTTTATWAGDYTLADDAAPTLDAIAWYAANSGGKTHDVGEKAPNPHGLHDMLGNVWEWCADAYVPWRAKPKRVTARTKEVPHAKKYRTIRGACCQSRACYVRAAMRGAYAPGHRDATLGLRIAVDGEP